MGALTCTQQPRGAGDEVRGRHTSGYCATRGARGMQLKASAGGKCAARPQAPGLAEDNHEAVPSPIPPHLPPLLDCPLYPWHLL